MLKCCMGALELGLKIPILMYLYNNNLNVSVAEWLTSQKSSGSDLTFVLLYR